MFCGFLVYNYDNFEKFAFSIHENRNLCYGPGSGAEEHHGRLMHVLASIALIMNLSGKL